MNFRTSKKNSIIDDRNQTEIKLQGIRLDRESMFEVEDKTEKSC